MMSLSAFIRTIGVDKAAELFDEKPRTVMGWLYGERLPRPHTAKKLVERARGKLTMDGIYQGRPQ
jgi:hypothetical protein